MHNIPHVVCGVIPPHMLTRVAAHTTIEASENARATLEHMRELAGGRAETIMQSAPVPLPRPEWPGETRRVHDAAHRHELPGRLVITGDQLHTTDEEALEAWHGSGATLEFFERVFGRRSIDGNGMRLDSTVHYGIGFENAMWNGRQMVYGDGDGRIFRRFTASLDVIAHELTHAVTQHTAALGYSGQTGALNEHISDVIGIMVLQYTLGQSANESDWRIGAALFGPAFRGCAVRSLALPGSAYDDPILGRDPQPSHMDDYVHTTEDNGGVHINSGILNHAFYLAAMAIGGKTWEVLGRIWYAALTGRLKPEADFDDFTRATIDIAGKLYGRGGDVQRAVVEAWTDVGLHDPIPSCPVSHDRGRKRRERLEAKAAERRRALWRERIAAERRSFTHKQRKENTP
jgi:Zn-dependent metalloprotease